MFHITANYLEHDLGTKFYEVVTILEADGPGLTIKRWGAIALKNGGGQTKVERGSHDVVRSAAANIMREKTKKGYEVKPSVYGFNRMPGTMLTIDAERLLQEAQRHYGKQTCDVIASYFALLHDDGIVSEEPASKAPEPEPERDGRWGSW